MTLIPVKTQNLNEAIPVPATSVMMPGTLPNAPEPSPGASESQAEERTERR